MPDTGLRPAWLSPNASTVQVHATADGSTDDVRLQEVRENDDVPNQGAFPTRSTPTWRPGSVNGALTGNQVAAAVTNDAATSARAHQQPGTPNYFDNEIVTDVTPPAPLPQDYVNERDQATPGLRPDMSPPRAGWTSRDNTRTSQAQRAYVIRPFDKLVAEHPAPLGRPMQPPPLAARPRQYADPILNPFPTPAGSGATKGAGPGWQNPPVGNTQRIMPNQWDEQFIVSTPPPAAAQATQDARRANGWRGR